MNRPFSIVDPPVEPPPLDQPEVHETRTTARYVDTIAAAIDVASARLLGLLSIIGALAIWGAAVWAPETMRLAAATGYSMLVLMPVMVLYMRKG